MPNRIYITVMDGHLDFRKPINFLNILCGTVIFKKSSEFIQVKNGDRLSLLPFWKI